MLKLHLKPTLITETQEIQYYDLFVSQDLSYISGRTSLSNGVMQGENIRVVNNDNKFVNICKAETENVKVQGKVVIYERLPVKEVTKAVNFVSESEEGGYVTEEETVPYVEYNNNICYYSKKANGYIINNIFYEASDEDKYVTIKKYYYIENGYVEIGGEKYYVDFSTEKPSIKGVSYDDIIDYTPEKWKRETKFILRKKGNSLIAMDAVMYGGYSNYVTYKGENYSLKQIYGFNETGDSEYLGFGVQIDGNFYGNIILNSVSEDVFAQHKDIDLASSFIKIDDDTYLDVNSYICSYDNGGSFLLLVAKSNGLDLIPGHRFIAKTDIPINTKIYTEVDENSNEYVMYSGKRHDVLSNLFDYVIISEGIWRLEYDEKDETKAKSFVNGDTIYFTISDGKAIPDNNIYYGNDYDIKYGKFKDGYEIHYNEGVKIGDNYYRIKEESFGEEEVVRFIEVIANFDYELEILEKNGSSTYVCYPVIEDYEIYGDVERDDLQRRITSDIVENLDYFTFYVKNEIFGSKIVYPDNFVYEAVTSNYPFTTSNKLNLSLFKIDSYVNVKLPISNNTGNNILRDDIINNSLTKDAINSIVDMEKDVYYPVFYDETATDKSKAYLPIKEIRFNIHFRTRQLDSWKVIEDYVENKVETSANYSNWFITDYQYYKDILKSNDDKKRFLHNASDLVGYMNFTDSEVKNMANKISNSFLRLSFYSTDNPHTQVLLGTSTIFMDEAYLAKRFYSLKKNAGLKFIRTQSYQKLESNDDEDMYLTDSITVDSEVYENYYFADNMRLGSEFKVYDKYATDTSSEGFYFYMFREFANNMRPMTIYMKVEFNHAGIGSTIPFMLPRKNFSEEHINGEPLYIFKEEDLKTLKRGFKLKDIYKQIYIPINVIYDDVNNKYVYYLPNDIRENNMLGVDNRIMEFNLFEIKFKDESIKDESYI